MSSEQNGSIITQCRALTQTRINKENESKTNNLQTNDAYFILEKEQGEEKIYKWINNKHRCLPVCSSVTICAHTKTHTYCHQWQPTEHKY